MASPSDTGDALRGYARARTRRRHFFGDLFADPAWDMIVALVLAEIDQRRLSVDGVCVSSDAPATTALRHLARLHAAGLVERHRDTDRRRAWITLTDAGRKAWQDWLDTFPPDPLGVMRRAAQPLPVDEDVFERQQRLASELAAGPVSPARAAAIRMELDALAPIVTAKLQTAEAFAKAWGGQ